jgi:hypothetical protein
VSFTYASTSIFDATQIHSALIGFRSSNDPLNDERCVTDTQLYPTGRASIGQCGTVTPLTTEVVPEPVTVTLLGTGLLGVGAARWRRRREPEA